MKPTGTLYIVPTPIGNLEDITLRAIQTLKDVDLILAEDTRTSATLLQRYQIKNKLQSYHKFNEHRTLEHLLSLLHAGNNIALISDAGTPGISDPGFLLTRACKQSHIEVRCLPGATAFVPALAASGIPSDRFCFEGFLPQKKGRQTRLEQLRDEQRTMIFYESPHRLQKTLTQFSEYFGGNRTACIAREISKIYEENITDTLETLITHYQTHEVKGEFVIIVAGKEEESGKIKNKYRTNNHENTL